MLTCRKPTPSFQAIRTCWRARPMVNWSKGEHLCVWEYISSRCLVFNYNQMTTNKANYLAMGKRMSIKSKRSVCFM